MYQTIWSLGGCRSFGRVYLRALGRLAAGSGSEGLSEAEPVGLSGPGVPGTPIAPPSGRPKSPQYPARRKASGLLAGPCLLALLLVAFFTVCLCPPAWSQTTYTWKYSDQGGGWSVDGNWDLSGYPNASDHIAKFTLGLSDHRSITFSENITLNQILSTNTGSSRLEIGSAGYTLTFAGSDPKINVGHASGGNAGVWINALVDVGTVGVTSIGRVWNSVRFAGGVRGSGTITVGPSSGIELASDSPDFSGNFVVEDGGLLQARRTSATVLGDTTGKTIIKQGGWFWFRDMGTSVTISEPFEIQGVHSRGSIQCYAGSVTMNGQVTLQANGSFSVRAWASAEPGNTHTFTINSSINDNGTGKNVYFLGDYQGDSSGRYSNARKNVIVLGAQNTYGGNTYITSNWHDPSNPFTGNVRLGTNNALPTTTKVILGGRHDAGGGVYIGTTQTAPYDQGNGKLILNGYNQELAGLETAGTGTANRVVGGSSTQSTLTLNIPAATTNTFAGVLGGPDANENNLALYKKGEGTLILTGQNTYTGTTTVSAGVLRITNAQALGSGDGTAATGTIVQSGARLELAGGITVSNEALTIAGNGGNLYGALQSASGSNTWAGPITLAANDTRIGANGSGQVLTVSGVISDGGNNYNLIVRNADTGGETILSGQNTYGGATRVLVGTLKIAGGDNRLPTASPLQIGNTSNVASALFDLNGYNQQVAGLVSEGTTMSMTVTNSSATAATLTINNTADRTYAGVISGKLNLVKQGTGTQTLSGQNTYTGTTTVSQGVLKITHPNALGATGAGQGTTVADGARLELSGGITVNEPITIAGHGGNWSGALRSTGSGNTWAGPITAGSGARIGTDNNTFTITGGITGSGVYLCGWSNGTIRIKDTPITLTGAFGVVDNTTGLIEVTGNSWTSTAISYGGILKLGVSDALPSSTVVTLGSGTTDGTFDLNGYSQTIGGLQDAGSGNRQVINSGAGASTLTINNTDNYTFAGVIQGNINLVKQGTGTQTLSGQNTYTGTTTVTGGTLALSSTGNNNIPNSPNIRIGSGATLNVTGLAGSLLRLATGQTLQGNGTVQGNVEAPAGSFLAAGMSPGHLTITGNYTQAGTLLVELAGYVQGGTQAVPGQWQTNGYDWVSVGGSAVLDGYLNIQLLAGFQPASGDVFNVLTAAGGITDQGLDLLWQPGSLLPGQYWTYRIVAGQGGPNEQILQLQLGVPEPASGLLAGLALGALGLWLLRRRFCG